MNTALLLIDLQEDFLDGSGLQPCRGALIDAAAALLEDFRFAGRPVVHVWTTITSPEEALPHWQRQGNLRCRAGTPGHAPPPSLTPRSSEWIQHKRFFSAFRDGSLLEHLRSHNVSQVVLAGVHLRTCIRAHAMDADQLGLAVLLAADATGDDDPLHGSLSRDWLVQRGIASLGSQELRHLLQGESVKQQPPLGHVAPARPNALLWEVPPTSQQRLEQAVAVARKAQPDWSAVEAQERQRHLARFPALLEDARDALALAICDHTGKPLRFAEAEVGFAIALVRSALACWPGPRETVEGDGWRARRRPLGVVAAITPWNNPLAIPLGKLTPALLHGNAVVWKPAIPGIGVARHCLELLKELGLPSGLVTLLEGDAGMAAALMAHHGIDAISLTGGAAAGLAAQIAATRRCLPLQAELGGNNAAIVWTDADLPAAARAVAAGAFDAAGQRCTANRRVIVAAEVIEAFREELHQAIAALPWGDPRDRRTRIGPVISSMSARRLEGLILRARSSGVRVTRWGMEPPVAHGPEHAWVAPTLIEADDAQAEWVQNESFGPILILQQARSWEEALMLCRGVRQGLAAALFSSSGERWQEFQQSMPMGILRYNASTAGAAADAPFGGWGASGIGPAEHGVADQEFYSRWQTTYAPGIGTSSADAQALGMADGLGKTSDGDERDAGTLQTPQARGSV